MMRTRIARFGQLFAKANYSMATFVSKKAETLRLLAEASESMRELQPRQPIAQGIKGSAELITGNFKEFTETEASMIAASLKRGKTLVLIFDRDTIQVPVNERAGWIRHYFGHHPNLEIRNAYAPPAENAMDDAMNYIKQRIPANITISAVSCMENYSEKLATHLDVPHIKSEPKSTRPSAIAKKRVHNPFSSVIPAEKFAALVAKSQDGLKEQIKKTKSLPS